MSAFPFPDRIGSREELSRDLLYRRIDPVDRERIADEAWEIGAAAARAIVAEWGVQASIRHVAAAEGLSVDRVDRDNVAGGVRYFSEYYSGRRTIVLYGPSIRKWAEANGLSREAAEELILAHEFFHHLECVRLGLTSRRYTVPTLKLGPFTILKSGIRALSEIGAHGFAMTFFESCGSGVKG